MPKFLVEAAYNAEGLRGLAKEKPSGRKAAVAQALKKVGGKLDAMYFCLGDADAIVIADLPDHVTAAAVGAAVSASGVVRTKTTALITVEEMEKALAKNTPYRAPGA